jgi:hypothetical protein
MNAVHLQASCALATLVACTRHWQLFGVATYHAKQCARRTKLSSSETKIASAHEILNPNSRLSYDFVIFFITSGQRRHNDITMASL